MQEPILVDVLQGLGGGVVGDAAAVVKISTLDIFSSSSLDREGPRRNKAVSLGVDELAEGLAKPEKTKSQREEKVVATADLPADLLDKIAGRLQNHCCPDVLRIRSLCRSWRSSIPVPPVVPSLLKLPIPIHPDSNTKLAEIGNFYLKECIVYSIRPISNPHATPWLVRLESSESGAEILPVVGNKKLGTEFYRPMSLELQHFRVDVVCKYYVRCDYQLHYFDSAAAISTSTGMIGDGVRILMQDDVRKWNLMTLRVGDDKWTGTGSKEFDAISTRHDRFSAVIYHRDKFYAFTLSGLVITVDPNTMNTDQFASGR
ncbi:hypothetical protein Tsubulata_035332 [Turnera subulata]|uniref:F-box domain-containing protein n=1 Tax=Turnera subulata TaxID=218843 RepID=A0A9Q0FS37_9ROSI|nr:hypothetical protein Tsubulata_035332 [Turnera subulata]